MDADSPPAVPSRGDRVSTAVAAALLGLLAAAVYLPAAGNGFIEYHDDTTYVTQNAEVRAGLTLGGLAWASTSRHALNWHPLTWVSHMLDAQLFGLDPRGHHLVNVGWHLANTVLLFLVLRAMTGARRPSAFAAAVFAVHPLNVESVAWVAERKNVLSTFFWLLTMAAHLRFARGPSAGRRLQVLLALSLGLMAKPMLVTLPLVLLLVDFWPLGRARGARAGGADTPAGAGRAAVGLVGEKLPLLLAAAAAGALAYAAQSAGGVVRSWESFPLPVRVGNAVVSYVRYLGAMMWPFDLAFLYPHPRGSLPLRQVAGACALLAGVTAVALRQRRRRPALCVGWLWFGITLLPVIGLIQLGGQAMADRYAYVPMIGLFIAIGWGFAGWVDGVAWRRRAAALAAVAALAALASLARAQIAVWKDSATLFAHSLRAGGEDWLLRNSLGLIAAERGDDEGAMRQFAIAMRLQPGELFPLVNMGAALGRQGRLAEALEYFAAAERLAPGNVEVLNNLGVVMERMRLPGRAMDYYRRALRVSPGDPRTLRNLERAAAAAGRGEGPPALVESGR